jgi:hypothetical protein
MIGSGAPRRGQAGAQTDRRAPGGAGRVQNQKKNLCQKAAAKTIVRAFILRQISY